MADIQLSAQLFEDIRQAVLRQEPAADQGVVLHYLAAVMGYQLGSQRQMAPADRDVFMDELCAFARHVCQDVAGAHTAAPAAAPGEAFGYWRPDRP